MGPGQNPQYIRTHFGGEAVGFLTSRITSVEQIVNTLSAKMVSFAEVEHHIISLTARMCKFKEVRFPPQVPPVRQDPGQIEGPMTQCRLKGAGTQDADSTLSQIQIMKMLEVPFYYGFLVNNAVLACLLGLINCLQQPTCSQPMCPSGFTAKQGPHLPDLNLAREPIVKDVWQTFRDDGFSKNS